MRLRQVDLKRYCQFVDETLKLDPKVTVIVGKNDTGKSMLLDRFFDQYLYEVGVHGADRPRIADFRGDKISFSATWDVFAEDYEHFPLNDAFGSAQINKIKVGFSENLPNGKHFSFYADDRLVDPYERELVNGIPALKECFRPRYLFPRPHCLGTRSELILRSRFEARFVRQSETGDIYQKPRSSEEALLRLGSIWSDTRYDLDINKPWPGDGLVPRAELTLAAIDEKLEQISERITRELVKWWRDPPRLVFKLRLAGGSAGREYSQRVNRYILQWEVLDQAGTNFHGTGLHWFVTLIIQLILIEQEQKPVLLLLDEPAVNLHPGAQRIVAKLLDAYSERVQIIYATHSPFMLDWSFPQRLRVFQRDHANKRTSIDNKPYRPKSPIQQIWDPLKSNIGITMGDVAVIGEENVFVEGITDQIFLANSSLSLQIRNQTHFDLQRCSIIPYGAEPALHSLIEVVRSTGAKATVIADSDMQGTKVRKYCEREKIACVQLNSFADRSVGDCAIEDVFGVEEYLKWVNAFYANFEWYNCLDCETVRKNLGEKSLGSYLESLFKERFEQTFSKLSIAVLMAENIQSLSEDALKRLAALVEHVVSAMAEK